MKALDDSAREQCLAFLEVVQQIRQASIVAENKALSMKGSIKVRSFPSCIRTSRGLHPHARSLQRRLPVPPHRQCTATA